MKKNYRIRIKIDGYDKKVYIPEWSEDQVEWEVLDKTVRFFTSKKEAEKIIDNYFTKEKDAELSEFTEHGVEDYTPKEISDNDGQGIG